MSNQVSRFSSRRSSVSKVMQQAEENRSKGRSKYSKREPQIKLGKPARNLVNRTNLLYLLIIAIVAVLVNVLNQAGNPNAFVSGGGTSDLADTISEQQQEINNVINQFGKVFELTDDDQPNVANVVDADKLRADEPEFYADAINGDQLIILPKRKLAFLFRPGEGIIVNVAAVNINDLDIEN